MSVEQIVEVISDGCEYLSLFPPSYYPAWLSAALYVLIVLKFLYGFDRITTFYYCFKRRIYAYINSFFTGEGAKNDEDEFGLEEGDMEKSEYDFGD